MTLIEDARRIAAAGAPMSAHAWCWFCHARLVGYFDFVNEQPHRPDCPWLSLPRIVAALEAAQALVEAGPPIHAYSSPFLFRCVYCLGSEEGSFSKEFHTVHVVDDPWLELCSALSDT